MAAARDARELTRHMATTDERGDWLAEVSRA